MTPGTNQQPDTAMSDAIDLLTHHDATAKLPQTRAADPRLVIGQNALPLFGQRWRIVAMGVQGRLYLDTWRHFDAKPDCYKLVGFGNDRRLTRRDAAQILRGAKIRYVGAR